MLIAMQVKADMIQVIKRVEAEVAVVALTGENEGEAELERFTVNEKHTNNVRVEIYLTLHVFAAINKDITRLSVLIRSLSSKKQSKRKKMTLKRLMN